MLILLVDDHPLFLEGIKPLLEKLHNNVEVLSAQSFQSSLPRISWTHTLTLS